MKKAKRSRESILSALTEASSDLQWIARKWRELVPEWKDGGVLVALQDVGVVLLNARDEIARLKERTDV